MGLSDVGSVIFNGWCYNVYKRIFGRYGRMKETETLSYKLLCQLADEVKELEEKAMYDFIVHGYEDYKTKVPF